MTEQEKIDRAHQAAALLEHPLLKEALSDITDLYLRRFADAETTDPDKIMHCKHMIEAAKDFVRLFRLIVSEGRNAATKADHVPQEIE